MNKGYLLGGVALVVVLVLGMVFPRSGGTVVERVVEQLGAGSSQSTDNVFVEGGITKIARTTKFGSASTTPAGFRLPNSTTTIDNASFDISVSTSTAGTVGIYLGATCKATSTATLVEVAVGANAKATIVSASSTVAAPNTCLVVGAKGGPATGMLYGGTFNFQGSSVGSAPF